jgi:predicted kinase
MIKKLIILKGLPGCGKSTWAKEQCKLDHTIVRVCRDDIRNMLGVYWVPKREDLVTEIENSCVFEGLISKFTTAVIIDATNLNPKTTRRFEKFAEVIKDKEIKIVVEYKDFTDVDVEICIARDKKRGEEGGMSVGPRVIRDFYDKYIRTSTVPDRN